MKLKQLKNQNGAELLKLEQSKFKMALNCDFKPVIKHKNNFIMRYNYSLNCDFCKINKTTTTTERINSRNRTIGVNFISDIKCAFVKDIILKKVKLDIVDESFVPLISELKIPPTVHVTVVYDEDVQLINNLPLNHCDICNEAFISDDIMRRHKIVHFLPKVEVRIARLKTTKQDFDIQEDKLKTYSCRLCNVTYSNQRSLLSHKFFDHLLQNKKVQKEKKDKKESSKKRKKIVNKQVEKRKCGIEELLDGDYILNTSATANR